MSTRRIVPRRRRDDPWSGISSRSQEVREERVRRGSYRRESAQHAARSDEQVYIMRRSRCVSPPLSRATNSAAVRGIPCANYLGSNVMRGSTPRWPASPSRTAPRCPSRSGASRLDHCGGDRCDRGTTACGAVRESLRHEPLRRGFENSGELRLVHGLIAGPVLASAHLRAAETVEFSALSSSPPSPSRGISLKRLA
jgi:hypothetical protein